jgi:hypothetical protein
MMMSPVFLTALCGRVGSGGHYAGAHRRFPCRVGSYCRCQSDSSRIFSPTNSPIAPTKGQATETGRLNLFDPHSQLPTDNRQPLIVPPPSASAHPSAPVSLSRNT